MALLKTTFKAGNLYFLLVLKVIITIPGRTKVTNIRATLNTGAKVNYITLKAATLLELPIIKS